MSVRSPCENEREGRMCVCVCVVKTVLNNRMGREEMDMTKSNRFKTVGHVTKKNRFSRTECCTQPVPIHVTMEICSGRHGSSSPFWRQADY